MRNPLASAVQHSTWSRSRHVVSVTWTSPATSHTNGLGVFRQLTWRGPMLCHRCACAQRKDGFEQESVRHPGFAGFLWLARPELFAARLRQRCPGALFAGLPGRSGGRPRPVRIRASDLLRHRRAWRKPRLDSEATFANVAPSAPDCPVDRPAPSVKPNADDSSSNQWITSTAEPHSNPRTSKIPTPQRPALQQASGSDRQQRPGRHSRKTSEGAKGQNPRQFGTSYEFSLRA